jgi:hypothetical protein
MSASSMRIHDVQWGGQLISTTGWFPQSLRFHFCATAEDWTQHHPEQPRSITVKERWGDRCKLLAQTDIKHKPCRGRITGNGTYPMDLRGGRNRRI